jgi:hypothetical protein
LLGVIVGVIGGGVGAVVLGGGVEIAAEGSGGIDEPTRAGVTSTFDCESDKGTIESSPGSLSPAPCTSVPPVLDKVE